jgi:hypothetical protein
MGMADPGLDRVLAELEAAFDAAVTREEDEAAEDLAFSLLQDRPLRDSLIRSGPVSAFLPSGATRAVVAVGTDYVVCERPVPTVIPLRRTVLVRDAEGPVPRSADRDLVGLLRTWARRGAQVELDTDAGTFGGKLVSAGADHVVLAALVGSGSTPGSRAPGPS